MKILIMGMRICNCSFKHFPHRLFFHFDSKKLFSCFKMFPEDLGDIPLDEQNLLHFFTIPFRKLSLFSQGMNKLSKSVSHHFVSVDKSDNILSFKVSNNSVVTQYQHVG